jgi:hypothetical protein
MRIDSSIQNGGRMNFRAMAVISMAIQTLMKEMNWAEYGEDPVHTPLIDEKDDCRKLDLLTDMLGTLTRMMDSRIDYLTTEGKIVREWVDVILEICARYRKELEVLKQLETQLNDSSESHGD